MKQACMAVTLAATILMSAWVLMAVMATASFALTPHYLTTGFAWAPVDIVHEENDNPFRLVPVADEPDEPEQEEDWGYYEEYGEPVYYDPGPDSFDGFKQQGVRDGVDSETETWYSSTNAHHYRTDEWTADDEGYYRDADGYYVVSSDDYAEGEVIETSKGEAKVYDSGSGSGNTDMYVNW